MHNKEPLLTAAAASSRRKKLIRQTTIAAALAALGTAPAGAVMRIDPEIRAEATLSSNGNQAPSGQEEPDLAIELQPRLRVTYDTARLRARGSIGATATTYIGGDRTGTLYPSVDLGGTLVAIRDFLFVDADVVAQRQFANPFAPRSSSGDGNAYATYAWRIAPYIQGEVPRLNMRYRLRNEFAWTRNAGDDAPRFNDQGFEWRVRGEVASQGPRFGIAYQYDRDQLERPDQPRYIVEVGRAVGSYRVTHDLSVQVRGGYEWQIFPGSEGSGPIYGAGFRWQPTPRTSVGGYWEDRFFGSSWQADASHRTPFFAVSAGSARRLSTGTQNLFTLGRSADVFRSLDSILTTRVPDPIERAQAVQELMATTGLPPSLGQPVAVYSPRVDLQMLHTLSVGLLGARNSLVADVYYLSREGITATGERLPSPLGLFTDETQRGASLTYSRRLARATAVNATLLWQRTEGVAFLTTQAETDQWTSRVQYNVQLRPRTTAFAGARYVVYDSNVFPDYNEAMVFVGLFHRF